MWKLNSNWLSYNEYSYLQVEGKKRSAIFDYAQKNGKHCNSNLYTLYKNATATPSYVEFQGLTITRDNLMDLPINPVYISYLREHFELSPRRHTCLNNDVYLTQNQQQIIMGSLLGDGHVPQKSHRLQMYHSIKQRDYLLWKKNCLGRLICSDISTYHYTDKRTGKRNANCYITTLPHKFITSMRDLFYQPKKIGSIPVINQLNPFGLTIWYCDDGVKISNTKARICTNSFTRPNVEQIVEALKAKYGFTKLWINKDNMIIFSASDTRLLTDIILPYMPKCMMYKLENK